MDQDLTHVAVTVPRALLVGNQRDELLEFYSKVFGWTENPNLAIPAERIFLRAPSDSQYLTIRGSDEPMATPGYEHLGVSVYSEASVRELHDRAAELVARFDDAELEPVKTAYGGQLVTFRVRFRLPLSIEVQCFTRPEETP